MSCLTLPLQGLACLGASRRALASRPEHLFQRAYTLQHLARRERAAARARGATRNQKDTRTQERIRPAEWIQNLLSVARFVRKTEPRNLDIRASERAVVGFGMERRWGWEGYSGGGVVKGYNGSAAEGNNIMVTRPAFTCHVLS